MINTDITVIGDVHGCFLTLEALVKKVKEQFPNTKICISGDLVDRGPRSREVVQYCIDNRIPVTKGNHELMMVEHYNDTTDYPGNWLFNGGQETIESYKNHASDLVSHVLWMDNLPLYLEFRNCKRPEDNRYLVVSHSAIGKVWKWSEERKKTDFKTYQQVILWERDLYKDQPEIFNVHGHTPQAYNPKIKSFYANIDTGACYRRPHSTSYGVLTALNYPSMTIIQQEKID